MRSHLLSLVGMWRICNGIQLDLDSTDSIKSAASTIAHDLVSFYTGDQPGQTPGMLPQPYYWWEAGAMFGTLIDYWHYTGATTYNAITTQALLFQVGDDVNYEPMNESLQLGNDDQAFWAMATLTAAEYGFPNPPPDQPQWLALSQAVFNRQAARWAKNECVVPGGLRWQIFPFNGGYDYVNSISNGCFFNIAARLGKYTGNQTYLDSAEKTWDWVRAIGLIDDKYRIWDGTSTSNKCTDYNNLQWSYNTGVFLYGAATMWNVTQSDIWANRTTSLLNALGYFYYQDTKIMTEAGCEPTANCNTDQRSFKAFLTRWLSATASVAPWTAPQIISLLRPSAAAAAQSCAGGTSGTMCGMRWYTEGWDGTEGVGQQLSALQAVMGALVELGEAGGPVEAGTGGTSVGDVTAGTGATRDPLGRVVVTTGDKAGAGILTALVLGTVVGGGIWASI